MASTTANRTVLVYIGLGANLGRREESIREALRRVQAVPGLQVAAVSGLWRTEPRMILDQPEFLNACAGLRCRLGPRALLEALLDIERAMGRLREVDKGPRRIDLDVLLYGQEVIEEEGLQIPHPGLAERRFVLAPLAELAPQARHPRLGASVAELLQRCPDTGWIERVGPPPSWEGDPTAGSCCGEGLR